MFRKPSAYLTMIMAIITSLSLLVAVPTSADDGISTISFPSADSPNQYCFLPNKVIASLLTDTPEKNWTENISFLMYNGKKKIRIQAQKDQYIQDIKTGRSYYYPDSFEGKSFLLVCQLSLPFEFNPDPNDSCPNTIETISELTGIAQDQWQNPESMPDGSLQFRFADDSPKTASIQEVPLGVVFNRSDSDPETFLDQISVTPGYTNVTLDNIESVSIWCS